jgi:hypothetical protein
VAFSSLSGVSLYRWAAGMFQQAGQLILIRIDDGAAFVGSATGACMVGFDSLSAFGTGRKVRAVDLLMGTTFIAF